MFPEGIKGIGKLYKERYQLQRFGRGGFVKLALKCDAPIIPTAVVGAEEIHPMVSKVTWLAKSFGIPYMPVTPTFPLLGPLGLVPLPTKWFIAFGEPLYFNAEYGAEGANDRILVNKLAEQVRVRIQEMIDGLLEDAEVDPLRLVKLYTFRRALSPRRVALYLAEKKLSLPTVEVDVAAGDNRAPAFLAKNPLGRVPVLELDDGRTLTESDAIIEYLEELHPEPPLLGRDAWQRAKTREAERVDRARHARAAVHDLQAHARVVRRQAAQAPAVAESQRAQFYEHAAVRRRLAWRATVRRRRGADAGGSDAAHGRRHLRVHGLRDRRGEAAASFALDRRDARARRRQSRLGSLALAAKARRAC